MQITEIYHVAGKEFSDRQKALEYEDTLRNNLELRARNLKLYYWRELCNNALRLINHFCHYHKFDFGKYKDRYVGEIIMIDTQYVEWCVKNVPTFKLNKEEETLLNTSWEYSIGGWRCNRYDTWESSGDWYDLKLIKWEEEIMKKEKKL